ncbi:MAG: SH3 domain-containing protein [Lachnospiraceae bacterium]|nr:SH3 domain-containing protein [Lachnospiraceae bacterium]
MNIDDIREWISDNLRYLALGVGILFIVLLIFLGVQLLGGGKKEGGQTQGASSSAATSQTPEGSQTNDSQAAPQGEGAAAVAVSNDAALVTLVQNYYQALSTQNVDAIRGMVDQFSSDDEASIMAATDIESYSDVAAYTKPGPAEGTWVVYARYNYKYKNYSTILPGLSQLYVCTNADGSYYVSNGTMDEATSDYIKNQLDESDVVALIQEVQAAQNEALAADQNLSNYINNKGQVVSDALHAAVGTELTIATKCNVRAAADVTSAKLGTLAEGTKVVKQGADGDWVQIEYEGQTGYVRYDLFQ